MLMIMFSGRLAIANANEDYWGETRRGLLQVAKISLTSTLDLHIFRLLLEEMSDSDDELVLPKPPSKNGNLSC